jgi:hypothetical protein
VRVSGRKRKTSSALTSATTAATQNGTVVPRIASTPPMAGPMTKPRPMDAPIRPMPRARPSGGVVSATTACAEPIFEAPTPPMKRASSRIGNVHAIAENASDRASTSSEKIITGRRP